MDILNNMTELTVKCCGQWDTDSGCPFYKINPIGKAWCGLQVVIDYTKSIKLPVNKHDGSYIPFDMVPDCPLTEITIRKDATYYD